MKKRLSLVLALLMLTSAFAGCSAQSDVPMGMVRASNEIVDYDLFVPDEWTVDLTGGAVSAVRGEGDNTNISMMVWNLPHVDTTLADWWETYRAEFDMIFTEFTPESTETTMLDGAAANKYVYTAKLADTTYRYTQIAAIRRGSVYLMTMTELADIDEKTAEEHQKDLGDILEFFRWR